MIEKIILSKLITEGIDFLKKNIKEKIKQDNKGITSKDKMKYARVEISPSQIENSIGIHEKKVRNWSKDISFKDIGESKSLIQVYVQLDFYLSPVKNRIDDKESEKVSLSDLFKRSTNHLIILGQPGAGKTTSLKYLCHRLFSNEDDYLADVNFPLFIRLSELDPTKGSGTFRDTILSNLGDVLNIDIETNLESHQKKSLLKQSILIALERLKPLIVLDGFDEIPSTELKEIILSEIQEIALGLTQAKFVLTSRSGDFNYNIENANQYEICPLSDEQIKEFTIKWLNDETKAKKLFQQLKKSPFYDTTIRPLNLAHLTTIYEKYGKLPEKPKSVYRKVVSLLLEDWDSQRRINRQSEYGEFEVDRKLEFLSNLSFQFTYDFGKTVFTIKELQYVYLKICDNYNLPYNQERKVVKELETHNGLFLESGFRQYQFAHKSIQEYLTAEYIVALPTIPEDRKFLLRIPNELALAVAISSNPSLYLHSILTIRLMNNLWQDNFIEIFLDRLLLEKPDFVSIAETAISFCYIIEVLYIRRIIDEKSQKQYEIVLNYISRLVKNKFIKQAFINLKKYYDISDITINSGLVQLNKNNSNSIKDYHKYPDVIYSYSQFHF